MIPESLTRREKWGLILLMAAGAALRCLVGARPIAALVSSGILIDDAFYSFSFARELAAGHPFTVGGGLISNGFQPLYVALIAPFFWIGGPDGERAIRLALALSSAASVAAAWPLYLWARRLGAGAGSWLAAALWCFSPLAIRMSLNGLETSLDLLLLAILGAWWPWWVRRPAPLGFFLALLVLARFDNLLLMPILTILSATFLYSNFKSGQRRTLGYFARFASAFAIGMAPWALASFAATRHVVPQSGDAIRRMSQYILQQEPSRFFNSAVLSFNLKLAATTLWAMLKENFIPAWGRGPGSFHLPVKILSLALPIYLSIALAFIRRIPKPAQVATLAAPITIWLAAYVGYIGGAWFYDRYFIGILLFAALIPAWVAGEGAKNKIMRAGLYAAVLCYALASLIPVGSMGRGGSWNTMEWLAFARGEIAGGERPGMFQSGLLGYYTRGGVMNLDGVVNPGAADAMEKKTMDRYVTARKITEVIDMDWIVMRQLIERGAPGKLELDLIENRPPFSAWRIHDATPEWIAQRQKSSIPGGLRLLPGDPQFLRGIGWQPRSYFEPHSFYALTKGNRQSVEWNGPGEPGKYRCILRLQRIAWPIGSIVTDGKAEIKWPKADKPESHPLPLGYFEWSREIETREPGEALQLELNTDEGTQPSILNLIELRMEPLPVPPEIPPVTISIPRPTAPASDRSPQ